MEQESQTKLHRLGRAEEMSWEELDEGFGIYLECFDAAEQQRIPVHLGKTPGISSRGIFGGKPITSQAMRTDSEANVVGCASRAVAE